jgi:hypothetical protein
MTDPDPKQSLNKCPECGELIDDGGNCGCYMNDEEWAEYTEVEK